MHPHSPEKTSSNKTRTSFWRSNIRRILLGSAFLYGSLLLVLTFLQSKMLYFPSKEMNSTPAAYHITFEDIHFQSKDGTKLHGWWYPVPNAQTTILFCHGNAGNIAGRIGLARMFIKKGWQVFMFDYRGYGKSQGHPSEEGTYQDVLAAWSVLTEQKKLPAHTILAYGKSMGGPIAAYLAAHKPVGGLVLDSTFSSFQDVAQAHFPYLPVRWIARFNYSTQEYVQKKRCPLLVFHSPKDEIVPYELGQKFYEKASEPKSFKSLQGGHNDNLFVSESFYLHSMQEFIRSIHRGSQKGVSPSYKETSRKK